MNRIIKVILIIFITLINISDLVAQESWVVNASDYQYSMTLTGVLYFNETQSTDVNDKVGAFVNDKCIGVASPVYVSAYDQYFVFLMLYSNTSGDTINYKIFDSSANIIVDLPKQMIFEAEGSIGKVDDPYIFDNTPLNTQAKIISFSIPNQIGLFEIDTILKTIDILMPDQTNISSLISSFELSDGAYASVNSKLQQSGITENDFSNSVEYLVTAQDNSYQQIWTVTVSDKISTLNNEADIIDFSLIGQIGASMINPVTNNIYLSINLDSIVADFTLSKNAQAYVGGVLQKSNITIHLFSAIMVYKIIAEDGTIKYWTININKANGVLSNTIKNLKVYPTLVTNNQFFVETDDNLTYNIITITGQLIQKGELNKGLNTIQIKNNISGIFFIKLQNLKGQVYFKKMIF